MNKKMDRAIPILGLVISCGLFLEFEFQRSFYTGGTLVSDFLIASYPSGFAVLIVMWLTLLLYQVCRFMRNFTGWVLGLLCYELLQPVLPDSTFDVQDLLMIVLVYGVIMTLWYAGVVRKPVAEASPVK